MLYLMSGRVVHLLRGCLYLVEHLSICRSRIQVHVFQPGSLLFSTSLLLRKLALLIPDDISTSIHSRNIKFAEGLQ